VLWIFNESIAQTTTENYIKTTTYRGTNATNPLINITYFDGLGRPIQQIAHAQSGSGGDWGDLNSYNPKYPHYIQSEYGGASQYNNRGYSRQNRNFLKKYF
jgi:hypothetical protein